MILQNVEYACDCAGAGPNQPNRASGYEFRAVEGGNDDGGDDDHDDDDDNDDGYWLFTRLYCILGNVKTKEETNYFCSSISCWCNNPLL